MARRGLISGHGGTKPRQRYGYKQTREDDGGEEGKQRDGEVEKEREKRKGKEGR